jgi:SAM-dependent methyltransferase
LARDSPRTSRVAIRRRAASAVMPRGGARRPTRVCVRGGGMATRRADDEQNHLTEERPDVDREIVDGQRSHWGATFSTNPEMYGTEPSGPARAAAARFLAEGKADVLELGAGQGRDTIFFAQQRLRVHALDYADTALEQLRAKAEAAGLADLLTASRHDVREPLPFADGCFDACYAHMLFCMALATPELERLATEARRVLRPRGLCVYTVRTTADAHYGAGIARGDDMYESGGFVVHFFDRALVDRLASGYELLEVTEFEEGPLPRRLFRVTLRKS